MVVRWKLDQPIRIFDGRGENELYELDQPILGFPVRFRFLSEGRIAMAQTTGDDSARVSVFSSSGEELHRFDFGSKTVVLRRPRHRRTALAARRLGKKDPPAVRYRRVAG